MAALSARVAHLAQMHLGHLCCFVKVGYAYRFVGCRSGTVELDPNHPRYLGTRAISNNTGELEGMGHLLAWALAIDRQPEGEFLMVADSMYAINAIQALQRCNKSVPLVHTTRRAWRLLAQQRGVCAVHVKGHSGHPWNEMVDVLADEVHSGCVYPVLDYEVAHWYDGLPGPPPLEPVPPARRQCLPISSPIDRPNKPPRRSKWAPALHRFASFNALTLSPAELASAKRGGGLFVTARQAQLARSFEQAGITAVGLQECRLPASKWEKQESLRRATLQLTKAPKAAVFGFRPTLHRPNMWQLCIKTHPGCCHRQGTTICYGCLGPARPGRRIGGR